MGTKRKRICIYPCGCHVDELVSTHGRSGLYSIEYCPKHKAADELYEALDFIRGNWANIRANEASTIIRALNQLIKALAEAEGK